MKKIRKGKKTKLAISFIIKRLEADKAKFDEEFECGQEFKLNDPTGENGCTCESCEEERNFEIGLSWLKEQV